MTTARSESRLVEQFRTLIRTARVARQRLAVEATQVQPGMVGILAAIGSTGEGCHPKELAARCGLDASTISRAIATLVARSLVHWSAPEIEAFAAALARFVDDAMAYLDRTSSTSAAPAGVPEPTKHETPTLEAAL